MNVGTPVRKGRGPRSRGPGPGIRQAGQLLRDGEFRVKGGSRVFAGPYVERARLDYPVLRLRAPELELILAKREGQCLRFARLQGRALKSLELAHRARSRPVALVDVKLRDSVSGDRAGIGHINRDFSFAVRAH